MRFFRDRPLNNPALSVCCDFYFLFLYNPAVDSIKTKSIILALLKKPKHRASVSNTSYF